MSAVQYAKGQFVIPSLAPLVYNIGIIIGGVLLSSRIGITGFAVGVLARSDRRKFPAANLRRHGARAQFSGPILTSAIPASGCS